MARPPKYTAETDKPVSVSLRIPRDLYDQAQHHAQQRRTTLTELMVEGLRLRLETPLDPRDILVAHDNTVMQELKQMIAAEVQAALAAQSFRGHESMPIRESEQKRNAQHYSNTERTPDTAPQPRPHDKSQPSETCPPFDPDKFVLGKLCPRSHEWGQTGQTRLRLPSRNCPECVNLQKRQKRKANHGMPSLDATVPA